MAAERQRLNNLLAQVNAAVKSTEQTWYRARQLIEKITVMRHAIFTRNLLERANPRCCRAFGAMLPTACPSLWNACPAIGVRGGTG